MHRVSRSCRLPFFATGVLGRTSLSDRRTLSQSLQRVKSKLNANKDRLQLFRRLVIAPFLEDRKKIGRSERTFPRQRIVEINSFRCLRAAERKPTGSANRSRKYRRTELSAFRSHPVCTRVHTDTCTRGVQRSFTRKHRSPRLPLSPYLSLFRPFLYLHRAHCVYMCTCARLCACVWRCGTCVCGARRVKAGRLHPLTVW